jgi:hypothetical protein
LPRFRQLNIYARYHGYNNVSPGRCVAMGLYFRIRCYVRCLGIDIISVYQWICHNILKNQIEKRKYTANNNVKIKSILKRYPCVLNTLQWSVKTVLNELHVNLQANVTVPPPSPFRSNILVAHMNEHIFKFSFWTTAHWLEDCGKKLTKE